MGHQARRLDLATGATTDLRSAGIFVSRPSVASDGTVLIVGSNGLTVSGTERRVLREGRLSAAAMDDAATTVVYETVSPLRLFMIDLATRRQWQLGPDDRDSFQPSHSNDGGRFLRARLTIGGGWYSWGLATVWSRPNESGTREIGVPSNW